MYLAGTLNFKTVAYLGAGTRNLKTVAYLGAETRNLKHVAYLGYTHDYTPTNPRPHLEDLP